MKNIRNKLLNLFPILLYVFLVIFVWYYISTFLVDKDSIRSIISEFGLFAPLVFIFIQIGQNIIAPIAHYPILLAGGFIFGPFMGFLYNWIGTVIGTTLIILLSRKFGKPFIRRAVSNKFIEKYDGVIKKLSPFGLFLIYALPVFPDDEISYLIGVSAMPIKGIFFAIVLGKIPGASLSFMGDETINGMFPIIIIQATVLIIGFLFYFKINIKNFLKKFNNQF